MATQRKHHERQKVQNIQRLEVRRCFTPTHAHGHVRPKTLSKQSKNINHSNKALISDHFETDTRFQSSDKHKRISFKSASPLNAPLGARKRADARCIEHEPSSPILEGGRHVPTELADRCKAWPRVWRQTSVTCHEILF